VWLTSDIQIVGFWHYRIGVLEFRVVVHATDGESGTALASRLRGKNESLARRDLAGGVSRVDRRL